MSVLSSSSNRPSKMATLHKLKFLALHCGAAAQSPTRSPRTSPLIQLRRKKPSPLMLLGRSGSSRRSDRRRECPAPVPERSSKSSLEELFGSSPPFEGYGKMRKEREEVAVAGGVGPPGSPRPGWTGFRYKSLLSKISRWRPVLVTIPE